MNDICKCQLKTKVNTKVDKNLFNLYYKQTTGLGAEIGDQFLILVYCMQAKNIEAKEGEWQKMICLANEQMVKNQAVIGLGCHIRNSELRPKAL